MDKLARKPSQDPVQEKLRQDKANWNKNMSLFINETIHFKKLMNGAPNSFFKQKSKITEPIPANPTTILTSLISDFQALSQQANAIIDEQLSYAKNHRPKQPKDKLPTTPPANDLSKQLAAFEEKYDLVAQGSNPFSRLKTRLFTRTRGVSEQKRINRMRLDMLESCNRARKALNKLQVEVVRSNKESIVNSHKLMQQVWNDWAIVARSFSMLKNTMKLTVDKNTELPNEDTFTEKKETLPDQVPDEAPHGLDTPTDNSSQIKNIITDYTSNFKGLDPVSKRVLEAAITNYLKAPREEKAINGELLISQYTNLLNQFNASSLSQVVSQNKTPIEPTEQPANETQLEATAQKFLKKWLGKKRHQYLSQNSSSYRLEVFEIAKQTREDLNTIMDVLEKKMDIEQLEPLVAGINKEITNMRMILRSLHLSEKPDTTGLM
jgi:hypothetical protein